MQSMDEYYWARDAVDEVVGLKPKQEREKLACERRLKQMERNRMKQAARNKNEQPT